MPKTDVPVVNVQVQLPGASAEEVETHRRQSVRLRPILMTTLSIIAGMLPIAFGRGAGAGSRASMAVTILGGQLLCLLLTLLVTPVV